MRAQDVANKEGKVDEESPRGGNAWTRVARQGERGEKEKERVKAQEQEEVDGGLQQRTPMSAGVGAPAGEKGR